MATMSNFSFGNRVLQESNRADNVAKGPAPQSVIHSRNDFSSCANATLFEEFLGFCESKKINLRNEHAQEGKRSCHDQKAVADSSSFRQDINKRFGHQLPTNVVDDLCKLVNDNTHGKCRFCKMPVESLVFGVLQILSDAAQINNEFKENVHVPPIIDPHVKDIHGNSVGKDFSVHCSQQFTRRSGLEPIKFTRIPINEIIGDPKNVNPVAKDFQMNCPEQLIMRSGEGSQHPTRTPNHESILAPNNGHIPVSTRISSYPQNSKEAADFLHGLQMNQMPVLDTPLVNCNGNLIFHGSASIPANGPIMKKKSMIDVGANQRCTVGKNLLANSAYAQQAVAMPVLEVANPVREVINLSDDRLKSAEVRNRIRTESGQRFPVTEQEVRYYNVICGLAHSQWSGHKAVEFSLLTSVTYSSLGESVEPGGKVDNFFVSGMCRYFFESVHPRQYPKVGKSLYTYNCSSDMNTLQKCFIGANSAYKLHLSDKLCFPVVIQKHWFVFLVDLNSKLFVFLDSYYDSNSNFQMEARTKLIKSFIECWHQYAQGYTSFDDFEVSYPPVPKQRNVIDCGIFAIKFMELWENDIDLRTVFDQSDIPNIRVKLAINMFFSPANTIDKSTVINLCELGINPRVCN